MEKISVNFLEELFLLCFNKKDVIEIVSEHFKYSFIPKELGHYKKILQGIILTYKNTNKLPSIGVISQQYSGDVSVQEVLNKIKLISFPDKEVVITQLDSFLKRSLFVELNLRLVALYNEGKVDESIDLQLKESEKISKFSVKASGQYYSKIFQDFNKRVEVRYNKELSGLNDKSSIKFGIDPIDALTGGIAQKETALWVLRSGVGKSTAMKWTAVSAVRQHKNVLHIQLEGSQEEAEAKYDQAWTAMLYNDVRRGNMNEDLYSELQKTINYMKQHNSDIYVHAFEQFNTASMVDVRNLAADLIKRVGKVDLIVIDYLKYLHPGDGVRYGATTQDVKMKKENASERIKNLAIEFELAIITSDQASDVPMEIWNDPNKVLTRHNISGAKGLPDSYSFFLTGNQTNDEYKNRIMRIHFDKLRHFKLPDKPVKIVTNFERGAFYSNKETRKQFYDESRQAFIY